MERILKDFEEFKLIVSKLKPEEKEQLKEEMRKMLAREEYRKDD